MGVLFGIQQYHHSSLTPEHVLSIDFLSWVQRKEKRYYAEEYLYPHDAMADNDTNNQTPPKRSKKKP